MSLEQTTLAHQVGLKLRLGSLDNAGEQKGVDSHGPIIAAGQRASSSLLFQGLLHLF